MEERKIREERWEPDPTGRSRGPIIALLVVLAVVLVVLVVWLVSGDSDDGDGGIEPGNIEVDIGDDG
jgi:hypothetical protein